MRGELANHQLDPSPPAEVGAERKALALFGGYLGRFEVAVDVTQLLAKLFVE